MQKCSRELPALAIWIEESVVDVVDSDALSLARSECVVYSVHLSLKTVIQG